MEKKKVYVVTCGEYEDYGISSIFSTEAAALAYLDTVGDGYRIEEWYIDEPVERESKVFMVRLKLDDKSVQYVEVANEKQLVDTFHYTEKCNIESIEFYIESYTRSQAIKEALLRIDRVITDEAKWFPLMRYRVISYDYCKSYPYYNYKSGAMVLTENSANKNRLPIGIPIEFIKMKI